MNKRYPEPYLQFLAKFNAREFYECHDLLEELWMEDKSNKFLQGMLQLAVGLYHFECGNLKGARWMFGNARKYLLRYAPVCWDLDVERVLQYIEACLAALPPEDTVSLDAVKQIPMPYLTLSLLPEGEQA